MADQLRRQDEAISTALITRPKPMTAKEWAVLRALASARRDLRRRPADLVAEGKLPRDSSLPGIHQTAASLVRKGWAQRHRGGGHHPVVSYSVTDAGRRALEDRARQGARDAAAFTRASVRQHTRVMPCPACADPPRGTTHTCGLSGLQDMLRIGGGR
jgi:DNA-binding MarR family transcriptional regulator